MLVAADRVEQADVGDGQARHGEQAFAYDGCEIVDIEFSQLTIKQAEIHVGVNLSVGVAGVDGRERVAHFREAAQHALDFTRLGFGHLQGRAHRHIKSHTGFGEIRFGNKLCAQQFHHENAANEYGQCQQHGGQFVVERGAQELLVNTTQPLAGVFKKLRDPAYGVVVPTAFCVRTTVAVNARVVPDAREHGVKREADKHGDQNSGHDGQAELVKELADDALHKANR